MMFFSLFDFRVRTLHDYTYRVLGKPQLCSPQDDLEVLEKDADDDLFSYHVWVLFLVQFFSVAVAFVLVVETMQAYVAVPWLEVRVHDSMFELSERQHNT